MHAVSTEELWRRFRKDGDPEARAEILTQMMGLVHHMARQIGGRVGDAVGYDDLVGAGSLGLVQAIGGFDPARGASFVTYATQRVRGAILDELRAADWRPRSVRDRMRKIAGATRTLRETLDRAPTPDEVAAELEIDRDTYWQWRHDAEAGVKVPIDVATGGFEGEGVPLADRLADPDAPLPDAIVLEGDRTARLEAAIRGLPEQQRTVLALTYYEHLSQRQIAEVLHVTESRISQIRSAAIRTLKAELADA
ncbi:MAG TPA: FliA/WhiG family RNA polymerase sigma factor [Gemmatimonadales bacterium]|nr:FliA/WhiG family RNA polymerase sigma factor [Gemmatimonadales bacterium]